MAWLPRWFMGALLLLLAVLVIRPMLAQDPGSNYWYKAQGLESKGMLEPALRLYQIISTSCPTSTYAARSLERQGYILSSLGRKSGDAKTLRLAVETYQRLATTYASDALAGEALLAAGAVAANDLQDYATAERAYNDILAKYTNNAEYTSEATLRLGRLALLQKDGERAKLLLQQVLQRYRPMKERCAEAQFHLGVTFQTLFNNQQWAVDAYQATIDHYGDSIWATNAKEKLGLFNLDIKDKGERRVIIQVASMPDDVAGGDKMLAAVQPMLAARGLEVGAAVLRGWSLEPFYAGFVPGSPATVVTAPFEGYKNVIAAAGLRFAVRSWKQDAPALSALQEEIDGARPPVVYNGQWMLAVGYDSERNEIFLQNHGAQYETVTVKEFINKWRHESPAGGAFSLLTFMAPNDSTTRPKPGPSPSKAPPVNAADAGARSAADAVADAAQPTAAPTATLAPLNPPTYLYQAATVSAREAHRRGLRQAVAMMRRERSGNTVLNMAALDAIARSLTRLGAGALPVSDVSPIPVPEAGTPAPTEEAAATSTPLPTAVATADGGRAAVAKARALKGWFGAPLQHWITVRRDAAGYLDSTADALHQTELHRAAAAMRNAIDALQKAAAALPDDAALESDDTLSESARQALAEAGRLVEEARAAEARAVNLMAKYG